MTDTPTPRAGRWAERALAALLVLFYLGLARLYIALDASARISLHPWLGLAYCLLGALPGLLIVARGRPRSAIVALALFALLVAAAPALDFGPRKPFQRAASGIGAGMSVAEVDRRMRGFTRVPAAAGALDGDVVTYRNDFGPGDVDGLTVRFAGGRVVARELLPD